MKQSIFKNTFVMGLIAAFAVVTTDFLNAYVLRPEDGFSWKAIAVALGIAFVGYAGKFLSGHTNTTVAVLGSALLTIVPLISTGEVHWGMVAAAFMIKFLGLFTAGGATPTDPPVKQ